MPQLLGPVGWLSGAQGCLGSWLGGGWGLCLKAEGGHRANQSKDIQAVSEYGCIAHMGTCLPCSESEPGAA